MHMRVRLGKHELERCKFHGIVRVIDGNRYCIGRLKLYHPPVEQVANHVWIIIPTWEVPSECAPIKIGDQIMFSALVVKYIKCSKEGPLESHNKKQDFGLEDVKNVEMYTRE